MNILKKISLSDLFILYVVYNMFGYGINSNYIKSDYTLKESEEEKGDVQSLNHHRTLLNNQLFNNNFNIHNVRNKLKYVDSYFSHAEKIKDKTMGIRRRGKQGASEFLLDNLKHGFGDSFKNIESIINLLPLLRGMNDMKNILDVNEGSSSESEIKSVNKKDDDIMDIVPSSRSVKMREENKSYNDILELVNLLS
ncbi:hypothetical protein [Anaerofustis sp.]|uniref:hypothetical protein n=1 Tax=Anaerofustis sp. TaxID=1872517 RepID=UPI0025B9D344|nr:hypothetical protein [Anaerofustis sp.]